MVALFVGSLIVFGATLAFKDRWSATRMTHVTATLSELGSVSLTPSAQPAGGISPVCGCQLDRVNQWRGITFTGREVRLERHGKAPFTEWLMSGPVLGPIELAAAETRMTVDIYMFRAAKFSPDWARAGLATLEQHVRDVVHTRVRAHVLKIITRRSLNVDLGGPVPVGAWIPLPNSSVELSSMSTPFPTDTPSLRLEETYPERIGLQTDDKAASRQGFPLGDFLGPRLVLWSKDEMPFATDIFAQGGRRTRRSEIEAMAPLMSAYSKGTIYAAVIRSAGFSTRIAAIPLQAHELVALMANLADAPSRQQQIDGFHWGGGDDGRFTLTVSRPLSPAVYARMRNAVAAHPTQSVRYWRDMTLTQDPTYKPKPSSRDQRYIERSVDIPESGTGPDGALFRIAFTPPLSKWTTTYNRGVVSENDRYPPLPPNAGFNVFGPLASISLRDVVGSVSIGDHEISWSTPRTMRLQGIRDFQNVGSRQIVVSVPMVTSSNSADLEFSAVGRVRIGGHAYSSASQSAERRLTGAVTVVGTASGLIGIGAFGVALFRWARARRKARSTNARR